MRKFKTKIEGSNSKKKFDFECYENNTPISIGNEYIFFFAGIADVQKCSSETEKSEINKNDRPYQKDKMDLVYNFWKNCYKIKSTNFDLNMVS